MVSTLLISSTISANEFLSASEESKIASTSVFNNDISTPSTVPVKSILPVTINPLPKTIEFPSEDITLLPAVICIGASNSILPVPEELNVISPSTVCSVIVSEPVSNIFIDSPLSVVTLNSVPVVESTCCPFIYNDPDERYKSLHSLSGAPKSIVFVILGIIETLVIKLSEDIDAVAVVLAIRSKLRPVTPLAGTLIKPLPSPLKEPVNEPDN